MLDLKSMSLAELKALAKQHNIKNISKLKKEEIIEVLKQILDTNSNIKQKEQNIDNDKENNEEIKKEPVERQYDENGRTNCRL